MSKELVISANRHETKVAILEDDQLVEIYFQRADEYSLAGSIHKGRVTRVLPGMQSAFVDLGLERDTFLYVSDFFEENEEYDRILPAKEERSARPERGERFDRVERAERPERNDRPERAERPERSERPERTDRPERIERPERFTPPELIEAAPLEAGPVMPDLDDLEETLEASHISEKPVAALTVQPAERSDDADGRDRRGGGRRSRRRRNRGRGFPDSKYASEITSPAVKTTEPELRTSAPAVEDYEFPVLPGESLAKYRQSSAGAEHEEEAEPDEIESDEIALEAEAAVAHEPWKPAAEPASHPAPVSEVHVAAAHHEEPLAQTQEEPLGHVTESAPSREVEVHADHVHAEHTHAEPELHVDAAGHEPHAPHSHHAEPSDIEPSRLESHHLPETETEAIAEAAQEIIDEEREGGHFSPEDIADSLQPGIELLDLDEPEEELPGSDEVAESEEEAEGMAEPAPATEPGSTTNGAQVREQGGRYPHRVPRRMRRKSRGGGGGGGQVGEAGQSAAQAPATRAESPRSESPRAESPRSETSRGDQQRSAPRPERAGTPLITELLKEGQEIIVQIAKEPLGQKGARITSHIALPGRYVVYMPTLEHMGVSRKIASDEERLRLKKILQAHRAGIQGGFIVRTAGEGKTEEEILADMTFLANLWLDIRQKADKKPAPVLLHHDLDIIQRILRDQVTESFKSIWVDNEESYESTLRFVQRFQPALVSRVKLYTRSAPIFDAFNITAELEKALRPKVWLKSGGYIVINQTEALVAIDVNTGKFVGKSNKLEDTIVRTNTDAVKEIVRQVRLRDLGGIIVVDFIDMDERKNRQKVMAALEDAMRADKAPYKILQFNDFGLVAITRKRVKQSLERALCSPCPYCEGAGYVKSVQTTVSDILQEAQKLAKAVEGENVILRVHPDVARFLKSHENHYLEELEEILRRPVLVKGDAMLHQDKFDLA